MSHGTRGKNRFHSAAIATDAATKIARVSNTLRSSHCGGTFAGEDRRRIRETPMKASTATFVLFAALTAFPAVAQESKPDYSRENLQRFVAAIPEEPKRERNIR